MERSRNLRPHARLVGRTYLVGTPAAANGPVWPPSSHSARLEPERPLDFVVMTENTLPYQLRLL